MTDANPNPLDWLIRALLLVGWGFLSLFFVQSNSMSSEGRDIPDVATVAAPSVDAPILRMEDMGVLPPNASLHLIETVDVVVMESFPMQVALNVTGYIPDGCAAPTEIMQARDGNRVMVRVFRTLPPDVICAAMAAMYQETIPLEGGFTPGTYQFDVNGIIVEIDL